MFFWVIVHHDPDRAYGITFPDLEGCFAAADEEKHVMAAAIEALDLYCDDLDDVPQARDLSAIHAEYKNDLAEGAYLIQVPLIIAL